MSFRTFQNTLEPMDCERATGNAHYWEEQYRKKLARFDADAEKVVRETRAQECKTCYYLTSGGMTTNVCVTFPCGICGEMTGWGNGRPPRLCHPCAVANTLCQECGGDLHMRERRRKFTWTVRKVKVCMFCDKSFNEDQAVHVMLGERPNTTAGHACLGCVEQRKDFAEYRNMVVTGIKGHADIAEEDQS